MSCLMSELTVPTLINYGEGHDNAKVEPRHIVKVASLMRKLKTLQPNCSFAPVLMQDALRDVASQRASAWKFTEEDKESFSSCVGKRLRTMCRHWVQALSRKKPPRWALKVAASCDAAVGQPIEDEAQEKGDDEDADDDDQHAEDEQGQRDEQAPPTPHGMIVDADQGSHQAPDRLYFVGWEPSEKLAWRTAVDDATGMKEYTNKIRPPREDAGDDECVIAVWSDDFAHEISAVTMRRWRAMSAGDQTSGRPPLWSEAGYQVRQKADRPPLIWLARDDKKGTQICQIAIKDVGNDADATLEMMKRAATQRTPMNCATRSCPSTELRMASPSKKDQPLHRTTQLWIQPVWSRSSRNQRPRRQRRRQHQRAPTHRVPNKRPPCQRQRCTFSMTTWATRTC